MNITIFKSVGFFFGVLLLISLNQSCAERAPAPIASKEQTEAKPTSNRSNQNMPNEITRDVLVKGLVRIGEVGIAKEDDAALNAYFADDFAFHGPGGDSDFKQLKEVFKAYRTAFTDFKVTRDQIVVEGNMLACRTTMSGIFEHDFTHSAVGTVRATGKQVSWNLNNIFRYNERGELAEEWVEYDNLTFLKKLGSKKF
jgi:predicted ester cyclase